MLPLFNSTLIFSNLAMEMPPKVDGCSWVLKFSTADDGFTLNSLVRKLSDVTSPVLILIEVTYSNRLNSLY